MVHPSQVVKSLARRGRGERDAVENLGAAGLHEGVPGSIARSGRDWYALRLGDPMKTTSQLWRVGPLVLGLVALAVEGFWRGVFTGQGLGDGPPIALVALGVLALGVALYRPRGWPSLALAAAVLPLAIGFFGGVIAALLAVVVLLARQSVFWVIERREGRSEGGEKKAIELISSLGPLALAVVAASWVGLGLSAEHAETAGLVSRFGRGAVAGGVYLVVFAGLSYTARLPGRVRPQVRDVSPLLLDALGWALGLVSTYSVHHLGWFAGLAPAVGLATLSILAARADLSAHRERRIADRLREVHLAGHRIIFRQPDLLAIARQIHTECSGVVGFSWFHFELSVPDGSHKSWWAGPETGVMEGEPEPPPAPPQGHALRRRVGWKVVERELATAERVLGRIKLWCDPRTVDEGAVDWLDAFLPEVTSSIERAFLNREARRDPLTDLGDRRALESRLEEAFATCLDRGSSMAVIMADLDHFKRVNDRHGHAVGDKALVEVARILEKHRREADICCRYGGEEFALVLEDADGETAMAVAERIREAVENAIFVPGGKKVPLRTSAGVAAFPQLHVKRASELVELADEALYEAKRQGRNRCLLSLGRGRFREVSGGVVGPEEPVAEIEPPTLFA